MRWPLVSRALYEELGVKYREAVRMDNASWWAMRDELAVERHRYDDLLGKYHELANPASATPPPAPQAPHQERSLTAEIIRQQAKGDPRLAAYLKGFAKQLKDDGKDDEEIAMELTQWYSTEGLLS